MIAPLMTLAAVGLTVFGYTGYVYAAVVLALAAAWAYMGLKAYKTADDARWGKKMFLFSLVVMLSFSIMIAIGKSLP